MSRLGAVSEDTIPDGLLHEVMTEITSAQERRAREIIEQRSHLMKEVAHRLYERESLNGQELREMIDLSGAAKEMQLALPLSGIDNVA